MAQAKKAVPEGFNTVTPMLTLDNAAEAIEWYKRALGATEISRAVGPDGKIMHAEIQIGNSRIMLHDAMMGNRGPKEMGGSPASLWVYVEDCDSLFNRALSAGGQTKYPMDDQFWGDRSGSFMDPFGYGWSIATHKEDLTPAEMEQRQTEFFKKFAKQPANA
jgi:PhnB protein